jgi:prepilin-type N-terminal cleavage/methylation domain-containing protein
MELVIKKTGFTLVELLVVMAILVFLSVGLLATLNPIFQVDKANDARRKKDLAKIKIAFEEYYNDKGCYPTGELLESLNSSESCGTTVFLPWLAKWPCDPTRKTTYYLFAEEADCPGWFKVITKLNNESDKDIPDGWYTLDNFFIGDGTLSTEQVNYGTSSTNTVWYEMTISNRCDSGGSCFERSGGAGACQYTRFPSDFCEGSNCYVDRNCLPECQVSCCSMGIPCD